MFSSRTRHKRLRTALMAGGSIAPLALLLVLPNAAHAGCTITGIGTVNSCDGTLVSATPVSGTVIFEVDSMIAAGLDYYPSGSSTDPLDMTLNLTGTTSINRPAYAGIGMMTTRNAVNMTVNAGPQVQIRSGDTFGGIWLRVEGSGNLTVDSAATIEVTGVEEPGITVTTLSGSAHITNSGAVNSTRYRGLYVDARGGVSDIVNTGTVHSMQAGARAINYEGLAQVDNRGTVETTWRQGLVTWSASGPATILNSGSVTAQDDSALVAWTENGTVTIVNSGNAFARDNTAQADGGIGHYGLHARVGETGDVIVENTGRVEAAQTGIWVETPSGTVTIRQQGQIAGADGIVVDGAGAVSLVHSGATTATTGHAVSAAGTTIALDNSGTITSAAAGEATILMRQGNATIRNSGTIANTAGGTAIEFAGATNELVLDTAKATVTGLVIGAGAGDMLTLDATDNGTFDNARLGEQGQFRGFETIRKTGTALLSLTGETAGFSGATRVEAGELAVNGDLSLSAVSVLSTGTVSGRGTVGNLTVGNGGTLAPGNSIGTLTVAGAFRQEAGATYVVELDPATSASDRLTVGGSAVLDEGSRLIASSTTPGTYRLGTRYTILTATGGLTGTWSSASTPAISPFLSLAPHYDAQTAYLSVVQAQSFRGVAQTPNQIAVATALDGMSDSSGLKNAVAHSDSTGVALSAYDQMSGEVHAASSRSVLNAGLDLLSAAAGRTRDATDACDGEDAEQTACRAGSTVWATGIGRWQSIDGDGNGEAIDSDGAGIVLGLDRHLDNGLTVGLFAGTMRNTTSVSGRGSADIDSAGLGLYAARGLGPMTLRVGAGTIVSSIESARSVVLPGLSEQLSADYDARTLVGFGEFGYRKTVSSGRLAGLTFEPFVAFAYAQTRSDAFFESGGTAALLANKDTDAQAIFTAALRADKSFAIGSRRMSIAAMAGWRHAEGDLATTKGLSFGDGTAFSVANAAEAADALITSLEASAELGHNVSIDVRYSQAFGSDGDNQGVSGRVAWRF